MTSSTTCEYSGSLDVDPGLSTQWFPRFETCWSQGYSNATSSVPYGSVEVIFGLWAVFFATMVFIIWMFRRPRV